MGRFQRITTSLPLLLASFFIRLVLLCCSVITLGIFAYFLAVLTDHSLPVHTWLRAVTGIAGASTLYTLLACVFVFCCGGRRPLSALALLLDLGFLGAWIYVAIQTRGATDGCGYGSYVRTPIGKGRAGESNTVRGGDGGVTILPSLHTACRLQQAVFGVAIVAIVFYLLAMLMELALMRSHRKQKKFGPSPANNYTQGRRAGMLARVPFFKRKDPNPLYPTHADARHPDSLVAAHPEPEKAGLANGANGGYIPPTGTAVVDDSKETRYGSPTNGAADPAYGNVNPYSGTTTTSPVMQHNGVTTSTTTTTAHGPMSNF